ncbi:MAG: hypothetical protein VYB98_04415, partial [Actinomycetota bacterium]|nr:hypothetical protein [Actinomycetota bacterium]
MVVEGNEDDDVLVRAPGGITLDGNVTVTGTWTGPETMTPEQIRASVLQVDGVGSELDADRLDGVSSEQFLRNDQDSTVNGIVTANRFDSAEGLRVNGAVIVDAAGAWTGPAILSAIDIRTLLADVDGMGSGVSADDVDGISSELFVRNDGDGVLNGILGVNRLDSAQGLRVNGAEVIDATGNWVGADPLTALEIRTLLLTVDGAGSQISADRLDGLSSEQLLRSDQNDTLHGVLTVNGLVVNGNVDADDITLSGTLDVERVTINQSLTVNGAIQVGTDANCDGNRAGAIRFENGLLEVCDGAQWQEIVTMGGTPPWCVLSPLEVDGVNVAHARLLSCR